MIGYVVLTIILVVWIIYVYVVGMRLHWIKRKRREKI